MISPRTSIQVLAAMVLVPSGAWAEPAAVTRGSVDYVRSISSVRDFTRPRSLLGKLGEFIAGPPENQPRLVRPYGVTHDSLGRLVIADPGERGVHIFDFEKHRYDHIRGPRRGSFGSPIGVATDRDDNIYVSDSEAAKVYVFTKRGKYTREIGGEFRRPTGMVIDSGRRLMYVTDTLRHQVLVLGLDGTLRQVIGRRGTGPGEFNYPTALTLAGGTLYIVDAMNFRIQVLTADGRFLRAFGKLGNQSGTQNRPKGIAVDSDGHLYVVDALFETVQIFDAEGRLLYFFGGTGEGPSEFLLPAGIYIDPRNRIYVADSYNQRVQVFRYRKEAD
jgi:DNA-binding beta-propeller fold protein YncE